MPTTPIEQTNHQRYLSTKYFPSLDGLRALSILAVIWYHDPLLRLIWRTGFLGVHLFFVISGFLITTLLLREKADFGRISLKNFYIRRTLRIFPAYYLTLVLFLIACFTFTEFKGETLAIYLHNLPSFLTYTSNWFVFPGGWSPANPSGRVVFVAAWSLATEEQFYLFWPGIVAMSRRWFTPVVVMIGLIAANELVKLYAGYSFFLTGYSLPILIINSISTAICLGCLAAYTLHHKRSFGIAWRVLGQRWSVPVFMAIMLVVCTVPNEAILYVGRMFYICVAMTLAVMACSIRGDHALVPVLSNRPIRYIGSISYGMYLFHPFGINLVDRFFAFSKQWPLVQFCFIAGSTMAFASISYWTYERFFLRLKARFSMRRAIPKPAAAIPIPAIIEE
ncbi:MAG TPA: acyltransferase [Candidatus Kapabacteria bacterium]|nr:acyltransferase [Candidatus Kapabacteria bacterium]